MPLERCLCPLAFGDIVPIDARDRVLWYQRNGFANNTILDHDFTLERQGGPLVPLSKKAAQVGGSMAVTSPESMPNRLRISCVAGFAKVTR